MKGTWSARKTVKGWHGTWSAEVAASPAAAGTWKADLTTDSQATLQDFFDRLSGQEIAGTWRSSRAAGSWLLKGRIRPPTP
jgi:hypothetical protein